MRYELTRVVFEEQRVLEVTESEFRRGQHAKIVLSESLFAEERFSILLENYEEFERELLALALKDVLFESSGWSDRIDDLHLLNRRLTNLLTMCRVYVDHTPQTLTTIFGAGAQEADEFRTATAEEYDAHLGYRAMEALRNYVQHKGLPIHRIINRGKWTVGRELLEHIVVPGLDVPLIRAVGGFKATVLAELAALEQPVDVRGLTRDYITCLKRVHGKVRDLLTPAAEAADQVMTEFVDMWTDGAATPDLTGLELLQRNDDDTVADRVAIVFEISKRRKYLIHRNRLAGDLTKQVVTNKLKLE